MSSLKDRLGCASSPSYRQRFLNWLATRRARNLQSLSESVTHAAIVLDREVPEWASQVDTHRLDLTSNKWCILGQVYGSFLRGAWHLARDTQSKAFCTSAAKEMWVKEIRARTIAA